MKRLLILMVLILFSLPSQADIIKYKGKIWYEKPIFPINPEPNVPFLIFKTPIHTGKNSDLRVMFTNNKILILRDFNIEIYNTSFKLLKRVGNLNEKIGYDKMWDSYGLMIPSPNGDKIILGYANRDEEKYYLYLLGLNSGSAKRLKVLDKFHFPGIAPTKRARKFIEHDPGFADDYFRLIYQSKDFAGGYWIGKKIYFWFQPEYGLHFGGLYILDLNSGKLSSFNPKFDRLIGINSKGDIAYTLLKDEDAAEIEEAIYVKTKRGTLKVPGVELSGEAAFNGSTLVYETKGKKIAIFDINKNRVTAQFPVPSENMKILYVTPSGNRFFFSAELKNEGNFYVFDLRNGKHYPLFYKTKAPVISNISTCYDGEFVVFRNRNDVWAGYLPDRMPPRLGIKVYPPLLNGKTYREKINIKAFSKDTCFVSGIEEPSITFGGKTYRSGKRVGVKLKAGKNLLTIMTTDRAGNRKVEKKEIVFEKPVRATLREIGRNLRRYEGKVILLEGYAWGWMVKNRPSEIERLSKLPLVKGNMAKTRSDGNFSDGTALVFFPIAPNQMGKYRIYATIIMKGSKWLVKPLFVEPIK